jgi:hypothetical protein
MIAQLYDKTTGLTFGDLALGANAPDVEFDEDALAIEFEGMAPVLADFSEIAPQFGDDLHTRLA